jgi:hypothetical protein
LEQAGCFQVSLHVKADNVGALEFYEKHGFTNRKFLKEYYFIGGKFHDGYSLHKSLLDKMRESSTRHYITQSLYNFIWIPTQYLFSYFNPSTNTSAPSTVNGSPQSI